MKNITLILAMIGLSGCFKEPPEGSTTIHQTTPNQTYESGDLGIIDVLGCPTEAKARFTLGDNDTPLMVKVYGEYIPSAGIAPAILEVMIYDTLADSDPANDVLIGTLSPVSPWGRARLDYDNYGSFMVVVPIGAAMNQKLEDHKTLGVRVRISTTSWYGTITNWKIQVVTIKSSGAIVPNSFVRDN